MRGSSAATAHVIIRPNAIVSIDFDRRPNALILHLFRGLISVSQAPDSLLIIPGELTLPVANAESPLKTLRKAAPRPSVAAEQPSGEANGIAQIRSAIRDENAGLVAGKSESILPVNEMIESFFSLADHQPSVRFDPRPTALQRPLTDQRLVH